MYLSGNLALDIDSLYCSFKIVISHLPTVTRLCTVANLLLWLTIAEYATGCCKNLVAFL